MDDLELFDGMVFYIENETMRVQPEPVIFLDALPPCACGTPSDDALLRAVGVLLDGGFNGVCELKGGEPSSATSLVLSYKDLVNYRPIWLSLDLGSIEGTVVLLLLQEIKNGTTRTDRDLAAHAIHVVEVAYTEAGRKEEFDAAMLRAFVCQRQAETKE